MTSFARRVFLLASLLVATGCAPRKIAADGGVSARDTATLECAFTIVGGGVGGLHTAFRLGALYGAQVCLFEKEPRLGGRIYDITKEPNADGPYIAAGGRRIMEGQKLLFDLAGELGLALEQPELDADLVFVRGMYSTNKDDFVKIYPGVHYDAGKGDAETQLLRQLLQSPERRRIEKYPDFKSYARAVVGADGYRYLRDVSRFRGDFEYPLSALGYVDYLEEELEVCCKASYPRGGMSAFVRGMEQKARSSGVRIFLSEPVLSVDREGAAYRLVSSKHRIAAQSVVLAVPPQALQRISGTVAEQIRAQPQFKALVGIRVVTVAQWFDEPWWKAVHTADNKEIWRAWTTGSCINFVEIPQEEYAAAQHVIRAVYCDQPECVSMWEKLATGSPDKLAAEVHKGLVHLFEKNGITTPVHVPEATRTMFQLWPDAWYYVRAGTPFSNKDIFDWAVEPLAGERVGLVNEAYNPQRAAWSDAAYKSSNHLLRKKYDLNAGASPTSPRVEGMR